jgi:hypothetical protein
MRRSTRRTRIVCGLAVMACALAGSAASASATEFAATGKSFPLKLKGHGVGLQEFRLNKVRIKCGAAKVTGTIAGPTSKTLELVVSYKECTTGNILVWGKRGEVIMHMKEKQSYSYNSNGWVMANESIEMKAQYVKCFVEWFGGGIYPPQAEERPEREYTAAVYTPNEVEVEPGVFKKTLLISNEFKNLEWSEEGGGFCEDPELELLEGETGKYTGKFEIEVPKGNLTIG